VAQPLASDKRRSQASVASDLDWLRVVGVMVKGFEMTASVASDLDWLRIKNYFVSI